MYRCDDCVLSYSGIGLLVEAAVLVAELLGAAVVMSFFVALIERQRRRHSATTPPPDEVDTDKSLGRHTGSVTRVGREASGMGSGMTSMASATSQKNILRIQHRQPDSLWRSAPLRDAEEFTQLQYSAVLLSNPGEYASEARRTGQRIRVAADERTSTTRGVKLCVMVTAYNEVSGQSI
jgi:hypothetical protein